MMEDSTTIGSAMRITSISKFLERITDRAINMAEW